jgi:hypothetical protein
MNEPKFYPQDQILHKMHNLFAKGKANKWDICQKEKGIPSSSCNCDFKI